MRVLLAGATGTAGAEVLTTLLRDGHEVLALTRTLPNATEPQPAARKLQWLSWAQLRSWANEQESPKIHEIPSIDAIISCLASRSGGIKDSECCHFSAYSPVCVAIGHLRSTPQTRLSTTKASL